jgi:phospholipid-binding lipoprotein MlaA
MIKERWNTPMKKLFLLAECLIIFLILFMPVISHAEEPFLGGKSTESESVVEPAGPEGETIEEREIADPIEPWNRAMFTFNDRLYFWVLKPVAKGYNAVVPEWGRIRVRNVFHNILTPIRVVNCILQLKFQEASHEVGRFIVNSTGGVGGMFDVVGNNPNVKKGEEDLGQTLGYYGIGDGFYIVWPFLGPSSARDSVGMAGDGFLNPLNYITPMEDSIGIQAYETVNGVSLRLGEYEDFKESALDPYISMRNAYYQHRQSLIKK